MNPIRQRGIAALLGCLAAAQATQAADVVAAQECDKYINKHRTVQALASSLFGEHISARDGSVSFKMVDGELAGNGPPLQIVRSFQPRENTWFFDGSGESVAGWVLEIPRMKTIVSYSVRRGCWTVLIVPWALISCSFRKKHFQKPSSSETRQSAEPSELLVPQRLDWRN